MFNKLVFNGDENLIDIIKTINHKEKIKQIDCYVGYSNFIAISKFLDQINLEEVVVNINYSYNTMNEIDLKNNFPSFEFGKNLSNYFESIIYHVANSLFNIERFQQNYKNLSFKKINTKIIYAKEFDKFFHGKFYEIITDSNHYVIIGSSNLTCNGLGTNLVTKNKNNKYLNEINIILNYNDYKEQIETWRKEFNDFYTVNNDNNSNISNSNLSEISLNDLINYLFKLDTGTDEIEENELLNYFKENSNIFKMLTDYQKRTCEDIIFKLKNFGGAVLNYDVGLGKTPVSLAVFDYFLNYKNENSSRIIVPSRLRKDWLDDKYKSLMRNKKMDETYVLTHSIKNNDLNQKAILKQCKFLIIDEAHNFRNKNTEKRRRLIRYFFNLDETNDINETNNKKIEDLINNNNRENKKVLLVTATPYNNSLVDIINLVNLFGNNSERDNRDWNKIDEVWNEKIDILNRLKNDEKKLDRNISYQEIDKGLKTFIREFFNRLNKNDKRYKSNLESEEYYFPEIKNIGQENFNKILDKDKEYLSTLNNNGIDVKTYDDFLRKTTKIIDMIEKEKLFSIDAIALVTQMLLASLDSSKEAFIDTCLKTIEKIELQIQKYKENKKIELVENDIDDEVICDEDDVLTDENNEIKKIILSYVDSSNEHYKKNKEEKLEKLKKEILDLEKEENKCFKFEYFKWLLTNKIDNLVNRKIIIFTSRLKTGEKLLKEIKEDKSLLKENETICFVNSNKIKILFNGEIKEIDNNEHNLLYLKSKFAPLSNPDIKIDQRKINNDLLQILENNSIRFLISTDVLSEGHNLQDATVIFNYDNHYNPMVTMQRIGRVDRFRDYKNEFNKDIYKSIYIFNIWSSYYLEDKIEKLRKNEKKTIYADILGSDTFKYYIDFEKAIDYQNEQDKINKENHENKYKVSNLIDEIKVSNFEIEQTWEKAKQKIENSKITNNFLFYNHTENGVLIALKIKDHTRGGYTYSNYYIDSNYKIYDNCLETKILNLYNVHEDRKSNIQLIGENESYIDWLKGVLEINELTEKITEKLSKKDFIEYIEVLKIAYFVKGEGNE